MADLLSTTREPSQTRKLLLIGLIVALLLAGAFALFYRHENHAPLEAKVTRVLTLPLHVQYGHVKDAAGADETDDVLYIVPILEIKDRSDVPLFLKDVSAAVTLQDGRELAGRRIGANARDRLQQLVPGIKPVLQQAAVPPIEPEQKIEKGAAATGYALFLYSMPSAEWDKRKSATLTLDFYHQDSVTVPIPQ